MEVGECILQTYDTIGFAFRLLLALGILFRGANKHLKIMGADNTFGETNFNPKMSSAGQELSNKIDKNREEIHKFLNSDLPLDIIYFNIRRLSASNERLINKTQTP